MIATDFEKQWGIPAERVGLVRDTNADLAVIARRKAGEKRHIAAIAGTTEWVHDRWAGTPNPNDGRLPEAAFDWPIYVASLDRYGKLKRAEVEALHHYGERMFGDAWWPGRDREDHRPEDAAILDEMGYFEEPTTESEQRLLDGNR